MVKLPWAADCCPCVEKLRTVLPLTVGIIRAGVVHLVSYIGGLKGGTTGGATKTNDTLS